MSKIRQNEHTNGILKNHWSMDCDQFIDSVCYLFRADTVVTFWFHTQEVTGLNDFFTCNIFVTEFSDSIEKSQVYFFASSKRSLEEETNIRFCQNFQETVRNWEQVLGYKIRHLSEC